MISPKTKQKSKEQNIKDDCLVDLDSDEGKSTNDQNPQSIKDLSIRLSALLVLVRHDTLDKPCLGELPDGMGTR
jgi:hypothetical protein